MRFICNIAQNLVHFNAIIEARKWVMYCPLSLRNWNYTWIVCSMTHWTSRSRCSPYSCNSVYERDLSLLLIIRYSVCVCVCVCIYIYIFKISLYDYFITITIVHCKTKMDFQKTLTGKLDKNTLLKTIKVFKVGLRTFNKYVHPFTGFCLCYKFWFTSLYHVVTRKE